MVSRLTLLGCGDKCNGFLWTRKLHQDLEWGSMLVSGGIMTQILWGSRVWILAEETRYSLGVYLGL